MSWRLEAKSVSSIGVAYATTPLWLVIGLLASQSDAAMAAQDRGQTQSAATYAEQLRELAAARARWTAHKITNYEFTFEQQCFCASDSLGPFTFRVVSGKSAPTTGPGQRRRPELDRYSTIDALFDAIDRFLAGRPFRMAVEYDPAYGYPRAMSVNPAREVADDEWAFSLRDFKAAGCRYEENCECAAPGITARWKAAYCMARNQTDDLELASVQKCIAELDRVAIRKLNACAQNTHWKTMICGITHPKRDVAACVRDNGFIPRIVERGPGSDQ